MADENRQIKLAAAKKKLKEYQQKTTPISNAGTKKKRKVRDGSRPDTPSNDRHSPDNIQNILKVLVSDLCLSNGVTLPPLGEGQAYTDGEVGSPPSGQLAEDTPGVLIHSSIVSNSSTSATNFECVTSSLHCEPTLQNPSAYCNENSQDESRPPVSSTESLRQLSQQLNGLLSESSSSYVNGDSAITTANEKELETRNQELAAALDSSNLTNTQLSTKINELKQQSQELADQMQKAHKEFEQKLLKEQGAMREQLQVHIQTIGILVSEKSELQTALSHTQQAARQKAVEAEELGNRLQSTRQRMGELERTLSSVSTQQKQFEKHNKELERERDSLKLEVYRLSKASEEVKQESSELSEQLRLRVSENSAMKLDVEDLRKKLEMADLMIQQFSNQSGPPDANHQLHMVMEEKLQLEAQLGQVIESIQQLKAERDQYAAQLKEEGNTWKERVEQLVGQVNILSEEREKSLVKTQELEALVTELQNTPAQVSQESVPQAAPQPEGPTESEAALQEAVNSLQQEKEALGNQLHAQVRDNEQLSRLCQEKEERMLELECMVQRFNDSSVDHQRILEDMQSDKATISRALAQNRELKEQLAELQNGFVKLTNENMELASGLQSEQHVKKEIAKKMGQLQEDLHQVKEQMEVKVQEATTLLEQRDQYFTHLQQYTAAYQQLVVEREELHKQYLLQTQLMDRLQHEEVQGKVQLQVTQKELNQAKENLSQLFKENEELKAEVQELHTNTGLSTLPRDQGDGVESKALPEGFEKMPIAIPEDFESKEEMAAFLKSALSLLENERDEISQQYGELKRQHQAVIQQMTSLRSEHQHHTIAAAGSGGDGVPVEVHEALRAAMEKLQSRFTALMQEKVDLKERVEQLEHRCIQLSGETDTIGEYIALYQNQRAIMKQRNTEKEEYISMLAKDKEEMKVKLGELQDLVMRLVGERNEWYSKYVSSVQNPDVIASNIEPSVPAERRIELNATDGEEMAEVSLSDEVAGGKSEQSSAPQEGKPGHQEDRTTRQIMQLLQEIQNPQARASSIFGENPCIPFFYRADDNDEVKIRIV
ncbi:golgin subfamily A member 2-like isoform X1 [Polyodon spathula]|uniref:golgin subfamily A member 2-like isoform X1 n=1 Tax=Polyodon spathula TaxID=7913 RepID=UPI001B7DC8BA|nr:golgin subfamily A member 2-like isoform X1 [Polyodon spathula]